MAPSRTARSKARTSSGAARERNCSTPQKHSQVHLNPEKRSSSLAAEDPMISSACRMKEACHRATRPCGSVYPMSVCEWWIRRRVFTGPRPRPSPSPCQA
jgi:hypothetical protein